MKMINIYIGLCCMILLPLVGWTQDVISAKEASELSKKKEIVLISAQTSADYGKVHALGSINVDPAGLTDDLSMLKPNPDIASILSAKGISSTDKIVIYDDGSMKSAGRVYWIFDYLGVKDIKVVEGGMKSWRINRLPVTKNPTVVTKATFVARPKQSVLADYAMVKSKLNDPGVILLDVRSPQEFNEEGHIPGAINLEYSQLLTTAGALKSNEELKAIFLETKVTKEKTIIVYCRTSVRAGIAYLALKSALDYPNVKVYDGAYTEWTLREAKKIGPE